MWPIQLIGCLSWRERTTQKEDQLLGDHHHHRHYILVLRRTKRLSSRRRCYHRVGDTNVHEEQKHPRGLKHHHHHHQDNVLQRQWSSATKWQQSQPQGIQHKRCPGHHREWPRGGHLCGRHVVRHRQLEAGLAAAIRHGQVLCHQFLHHGRAAGRPLHLHGWYHVDAREAVRLWNQNLRLHPNRRQYKPNVY